MINFGVLVYQNVNNKYSSINVGDYIQSLAAINIYKKIIEKQCNKNYEFKKFIDLVLDNNIEGYNFVFIKRDNLHDLSQYNNLNNIITIMNGWWMWPYDNNENISFKIPKNIIPIITSFHIYNNKLLLDDNIKEFKKYEPIGCRDLKTLEKLQKNNIDAYFSSCLTLTIDFITYNPENQVCYVDLDANIDNIYNGNNIIKLHNNINEIKNNYKLGFLNAYKYLEIFSMCKKVYTSRLHAYLPCLAMGVPVEFKSNESNNETWGCGKERFGGLKELNNNKEEIIKIKNDFSLLIDKIINIIYNL